MTQTSARRAAGYSRYSTDLQNERSIEDQEALIRRYVAVNGLQLGTLYSDAALSGASIIGRDGLLQMLDDARAGRFEVLVVEELDRLSRDMEDLAGIHKRLTFAGVEIIPIHEGVASTVTVGLRGLVGQLYREDNARKVRRGLAGKVAQGLSAGGRAYGYATDPRQLGQLIIVDEEAEVVRRIFAAAAAGDSPSSIAQALNAERIPPPRGSRGWTASTIYGWAERHSGILRNDLYGGRLVWNKTRMIKDPDTGKRVPRANPVSEWRIQDVPDLRIVDPATWQLVEERIVPRQRSAAERGAMRRPTRPLSGLLRCSACGGGMSVKGKDKSGKVRIECATHAQSRSCPAPRTYYLHRIENLVIRALQDELASPHLLEVYVQEYALARKELAAETLRRRTRLERRVADLDAELSRLVDFVARGVGSTDRLADEYRARSEELRQAQAELALEPPPLTTIALHPKAVAGYRKLLADLSPLLGSDQTGVREAAEAIRRIVKSITVGPGSGPDQIEITIEGYLRELIEAPPVRVGGAVVARGGLEPPTLRL